MGYASAMAVLLLVFSLIVTMMVFKFGIKVRMWMYLRRTNMKKKKKSYHLDRCMTVVSAVIILLPIIVMILTSFKTTGATWRCSISFGFLLILIIIKLPCLPPELLIYFRNSLIITLVSIVFSSLFNSIWWIMRLPDCI